MGGPHRWARSLVVPLALLAFLTLAGSARNQVRAGGVGVSIEQCQNGTNGLAQCTGKAWTTGNLNRNNSAYREGDFVPFRAVITGLTDGHAYTLRIGYDAVEAGLHAYDYLGTYDSSAAPGQLVMPCYGVADTAPPHACGNGPSTLDVPTDSTTTFPSGSQLDGVFSAWGGTLTDAGYVNPEPIDVDTTGTVERLIDVTFTAAGATAVLAWGGHIASNLNWGAGNTFVGSHTGASFHMRVLQINGASTGHQDLSMHGDAISPLPSPFTTQVNRTSVEVGSAVVDAATLGGTAGSRVSGVVNFFWCFSPTSRPDCTVGGTQIGTGEVVAAPSPTSPDGVASVQFVPDAAGSYCFRAEFVPSATALYSPAAHTNTTTECFDAVVTPPRLTVTKRCFPSTDDGRFNLLLDGVEVLSNATCGQSVGPLTVTPGVAHTVSETEGTGTDLADYTSEVGGNCAPITPTSGSITLANGESATCTITNTRNGTGVVTGTLTVNKVCVPADAGGLFEVDIDALQFADVPCGGSTGPVVVSAGPHLVTEAGGTDTSLSDYATVIGGDCAADGSVTVAAGGDATCTLTNTRNPVLPATLTVNKVCVPGSTSRFTITINGDSAGTVACGGSIGPVDVTPGHNTAGETGAPDYTLVWGGDCEADGTVFVAAGQQATCTLTNTRRIRPAMLTVEKVCVPSDDGGLFNLTINGQVSANQPCGDRLGPLIVSPGVNHVGESAGTRTRSSDYTTVIGGDCAPDGSVRVAVGQSATCTITNVRKGESTAQITIVKRCRPAGVTARFQLNLNDTVFQGMRCGDSTGPVATSPGNNSVGEAGVHAKPGLFRTIISGDCAPNGAITLAAGQHATCIVTNVRRPVRPLRPPAACYRLTVARRMVSVGKRVRIVAHVRLHKRGIQGVRVFAVGPGVFDVHTTDRQGRALFLLRLRRAGILRLVVLKPFACERPPPRNIGVLGLSQTFLTG
jgi:hypothetical protein